MGHAPPFENRTSKQWVGVILGFFGSIIVLGIDFNNEYPLLGILTCLAALAGITIGTLWQKKLSGNIPLSVNNAYQALGGCSDTIKYLQENDICCNV